MDKSKIHSYWVKEDIKLSDCPAHEDFHASDKHVKKGLKDIRKELGD